MGSLVQFFRPVARNPDRGEVVAAVQRALAAGVGFRFRVGGDDQQGPMSYSNLDLPGFEGLMRQHRRQSWTVGAGLATRLLTEFGLDWETYELRERMREFVEPLMQIDMSGILSDPELDLEPPAPATLEFPEGTSPEEIDLVRRFIREALGGRPPADTGSAETVQLSQADVAAIQALYEESDEDREELLALLRPEGEARQTDRPPTLDNLIANARAWRRVRQTAELTGEDLGDGDAGGQEPIVPRPVEGRIMIPESVTVGMEIPVHFQVTNPVDAFRVPHVSIRWNAIRRRNGRVQTIESDTTNYIEVREHGLLNERIFEVEFEDPGTYEIHAIVNHNFYTANAFEQTVVAEPTSEVLARLRQEGDADFGESGTRPERANYDFEQLSDIGSYDEGYRYYGELSDERFGADSGSFEDSFQRIDQDIGRLEGLVRHYRQAEADQQQDNSDLIDWATGRIGRLRETRRQLADFERGEESLPIAIRAYYASQTAGVGHRQLSVVAWFDHVERPDGADSYSGHLLDHSSIAGPQNLHFTATADSYEAMAEELFVELSEDYPAGQMSVSFQLYEGSRRTQRLVTFERTTRTLGGDIAEVAFSGPVSLGVNVVAAVLTVFPPTTGIGIGLGLSYNAAATAYDIGQAIESDTLRPSHAVDVGLLFLDVLPVIGRGVRVFTAAGRTARTIDTATGTYRVLRASSLVAEYGGEVYIFSEQAIEQIRHLHDQQITELAQVQQRIDTLSAQGAPAEVLQIEQRRVANLESRIRSTTAETLTRLAATQAITLATPAAAARLAAGHPRARPGSQGEPETDPTAGQPRPRQDETSGTGRTAPSPRPTTSPGSHTEGGPPGQHHASPRPTDPAATQALPSSFLSGGRPVRVETTERPGHGVRVRYEVDARGLVTRVWIEAGRDATRLHLDQHAATVQLMQRYQGLSGTVRVYLTRMQNIVARYTGLIEGPELLPGSRAFEAQAEIMKLPDIIRQRASQLSDPDLPALERAEIMAEIDRLDADLRRHMETFERLDMEIGAGYVAAEHEPRSNQAALAAGYPPLSQAPGHYYVRAPEGGFRLRRFIGSNDTPKRIIWENGAPAVGDRPAGSIVHQPLETLRPGEGRTYTGPSGTTATATRRRGDRAVVIQSRVGPGQGRLGYERAMLAGVEVGLAGWQRAHSQGQGTGHESSFGILYAPEEVNQAYQNRGVEQFIRDLFGQVDPAVELRLTTETVAYPGTRRLESITYRIDAIGADDSPARLVEMRIDVQNQRDNPRVDISAQSYADLERLTSGTVGRPPGTEPTASRPETPGLLIGPLTPPQAAASDAISRMLERLHDRPDLAPYRLELTDAQRRIRENPTDAVIANAHDVVADVQEVLGQ